MGFAARLDCRFHWTLCCPYSSSSARSQGLIRRGNRHTHINLVFCPCIHGHTLPKPILFNRFVCIEWRTDIHFRYVRSNLPVDTGAVHTGNSSARHSNFRRNVTHQIKIPRLCDVQRGFLDLQSAQISECRCEFRRWPSTIVGCLQRTISRECNQLHERLVVPVAGQLAIQRHRCLVLECKLMKMLEDVKEEVACDRPHVNHFRQGASADMTPVAVRRPKFSRGPNGANGHPQEILGLE